MSNNPTPAWENPLDWQIVPIGWAKRRDFPGLPGDSRDASGLRDSHKPRLVAKPNRCNYHQGKFYPQKPLTARESMLSFIQEYLMPRPGADEKAEKVLMVTEADKIRFDKLCEDRTWPQWRMFQEIQNYWLANEQKHEPFATS